MDDMILNVNTFPEPIHRRIRSDRVRVREENGVVMLIPVTNTKPKTTSLWGLLPEGMLTTEKHLAIKHAGVEAEQKMQDLYEFCGSGSDLELTVDSFLAMTHDEKELSGG
jgi:hypothetical protein